MQNADEQQEPQVNTPPVVLSRWWCPTCGSFTDKPAARGQWHQPPNPQPGATRCYSKYMGLTYTLITDEASRG